MSDSASSPDSSPGSENEPPPPPPNDTGKPPMDTHEPSPNPPSSESPRWDSKYSPPSPPSNEPPSSNTPPSSDPTPPESSPTIPPPEDSSRPGNSHSPPPPMGSSHSPPPPLGSSHSPPSPPNSPSSQLPPPPNSPVDPPPGKQPPTSPPSSTPSNNSPPSSTPTTSSPTPTTPVFPSPLQPIESPPLSPPEQALPLPPPGSLSPPSVETSPVSTTPNTSPSTNLTPGTPSLSSPPPPQTQGPPKSTPTHSSSMTSTTDGSSRSSDSSGIMVGVAFAGVLAITLVAFVFVFLAKRKRRSDVIPEHFKPMPPSNYYGKSDGNYYGPTPGFGNFGQSDLYYLNPPPAPPTGGHSHGSNRGYGYQSGKPEPGALGNSKSWFTYEELFDITNGFSQQNILGEGGFGCVYKGRLLDGREVAVKQLKAGSGQGEREFRAEVEIISRVHHRHLVSLVGYCIAEHHRLLVYEFLPNNTLEYHLHGKGNAPMELQNRLKIAIGAAKGLAYLHEDCHPRIIHRDIKSANILLDNSFEAQVADFGLAKLTEENYTHVSTRVMGTFGYMAPEYASSGKLTDRSDVFSFGVVLLELVTGRKSVDTSQPLGDESLVEWARPLLSSALETGNLKQIVDPRLEQNYVESEMLRMIEAAAACVRHSAPKRPRMAQVVRALDSEGGLSDISNGVKPGQSVVFNSGQYSADIQKFRQMAFGSNGSSGDFSVMGEYDQRSPPYSGEHHSREHHHKP